MPKFIGIDISGQQVGTVIDLGTTTLPFGFLACDGSAIDRTIYAALFAVIGVTFGPGDGSTTFNIPDCQGRATIGQGMYNDAEAGPITRNVGDVLGVAEHVLSVAEMPYHSHTFTQWTQSGQFNGGGPAIGSGQFTEGTSGAGGSALHTNMQPSLGVQKAIAYL